MLAPGVTAHTGPARRRGVSTVIPIWWTSTGAPVPALDATLELDPRPDGTSQLTLCGRYLPPLTRHTVPVEHLVIGPAARAAAHSYLAAFTRAIAAPTAPTAPSCRAVSTGRPSLTNRVTVSGTSPAPGSLPGTSSCPQAQTPRRLMVQLTSGQMTTRCPAEGGVIQAVSAWDSGMLTALTVSVPSEIPIASAGSSARMPAVLTDP